MCRLENVLLNQGLEATSLFETVPSAMNQNGIGRHVMNAFFKCLYGDDVGDGGATKDKLTKRERNEVSKLVCIHKYCGVVIYVANLIVYCTVLSLYINDYIIDIVWTGIGYMVLLHRW